MPETEAGTEVNLGFDPGTLTDLKNEDESSMFTPEQITRLGKFTGDNGQVKLAKSYLEIETLARNAVRWPDDKTSDKDRATFDAKIHTYQGVPAKPEDYEIDRSGVPEGVEYDEEMETNFRQWAHSAKASQKVVNEMVANYNKMMVGRHQAIEAQAKKAEEELRNDKDFDFDVKIGKPGDDKNIGTIKTGLLQLSAELKMDYKDEEGNPQSHLIDCLEFSRKDGMLGDKIPIIKALDNLLNYKYAEGKTELGEPAHKEKGESTAFGTTGFYKYVDRGGDEE